MDNPAITSLTKTLAFVAAFSGAKAALRVLLVGAPPNVKLTAFLAIIS
jgi:hypothetical protein